MLLEKTNILEKTDQELVGLSLKNKEYYGYLIEKYQNNLRRYIMRLNNGKQDDAEDVLQEVFIKVYKNLNGYDPSLKFSSWIYRIAHNETISFLRKKNRRPTTYNFEIDAIKINSVKEDIDIEGDIDKKILAGDVSKIINVMDDKYKEVLLLRYMEDKDYREISDILRKPPGTVATLLRQAKQKFKQELAQRENHIQD